LTLAQVSAIEERIGRTIPLAPDVQREEGRVELDALPEFAPGWLEEQLDATLRALFAEVDFSPLNEAEAEVEEMLGERFADVQYRMSEVVEEANAILDTPEARELRAKLRQLAAELSELEAEAAEIADGDDYGAFLPEPEAEVDFGAVDWLLDPDRDYLEQLEAYRRHEPEHRRRPPLGELRERRCPICDREIPHRKKIAIYDTDECKEEARRRRRRAARRGSGS
jgi:hypothetical protein